MGKLDEILQEIEEMKYPIEGIGCGLEDVGITDRYEAAEYGWNEAVEMVSDIVKNHLSDLENDGWIPVEERLPEEFGKYWATIRHNDGRISEPVVVDFRGIKEKYVVDTPNGREYETWGIDSAFHGSRVIAWMQYYIPEAYKPERG